MAAGPLARLLANLVIAAGTVLAKSAIEAYKQAVANGQARNSAQAAAGAASSILRKKITEHEAQAILNTKPNSNPEEVLQRYERLFTANDPKNGGSFYLQSKVYRAKEALVPEEAERLYYAKKQQSTEASTSSSEGSS
eukprot:GILK01007172.1.p1 GENE.GILK01007172.1~~GILK01007172.1.p1  ORF type:complete len:152 (-),score=29.43 GILK01007172.1:239-652(-)